MTITCQFPVHFIIYAVINCIPGPHYPGNSGDLPGHLQNIVSPQIRDLPSYSTKHAECSHERCEIVITSAKHEAERSDLFWKSITASEGAIYKT